MEYNKRLYDSLQQMVDKYDSLNRELEDPSIPVYKVTEINKQIKRIQPIKDKFLIFKKLIADGLNDENFLDSAGDSEMQELARLELEEIKPQVPVLEEELKVLLLPVDPYNEKNIIMEMRPAVGGDESSIFTADLFETYKNYCERQGWRVKVIDISTNPVGYDYIYFNVIGKDVYSKMKFESGVHRVQRIPATESKGRVHTSTITVAVMPELDEVDFKMDTKDLRVDVYRAGGAGGQHVNRTESAVRLTHAPTGIVVACDSERSQIENRAQAMKLLLSKIWEKLEQDRMDKIAGMRKEQVGTGDRSEKIRTYNYPQNRITDHRIGLSLNKLDVVMQGYLDEVIDALVLDEQKRLLENLKI